MNPVSRRTWFAFQSDASCCWWNLSCIPWKGSAWELLHCRGYKVKYMVSSGGYQRKLVVREEKWPLHLELHIYKYIYIYETFCTSTYYISLNFSWVSHKHHNSDLIHLQSTECGRAVCNTLVLSTKDITRFFPEINSLVKKLWFSQEKSECLTKNFHYNSFNYMLLTTSRGIVSASNITRDDSYFKI